jgi:hypothetical protein
MITFDIYDMLRSYKITTSDMSLSHAIEIALQEIRKHCVHLHTQIDEYEKSLLSTCYISHNMAYGNQNMNDVTVEHKSENSLTNTKVPIDNTVNAVNEADSCDHILESDSEFMINDENLDSHFMTYESEDMLFLDDTIGDEFDMYLDNMEYGSTTNKIDVTGEYRTDVSAAISQPHHAQNDDAVNESGYVSSSDWSDIGIDKYSSDEDSTDSTDYENQYSGKTTLETARHNDKNINSLIDKNLLTVMNNNNPNINVSGEKTSIYSQEEKLVVYHEGENDIDNRSYIKLHNHEVADNNRKPLCSDSHYIDNDCSVSSDSDS